jgi:hypothetical protein
MSAPRICGLLILAIIGFSYRPLQSQGCPTTPTIAGGIATFSVPQPFGPGLDDQPCLQQILDAALIKATDVVNPVSEVQVVFPPMAGTYNLIALKNNHPNPQPAHLSIGSFPLNPLQAPIRIIGNGAVLLAGRRDALAINLAFLKNVRIEDVVIEFKEYSHTQGIIETIAATPPSSTNPTGSMDITLAIDFGFVNPATDPYFQGATLPVPTRISSWLVPYSFAGSELRPRAFFIFVDLQKFIKSTITCLPVPNPDYLNPTILANTPDGRERIRFTLVPAAVPLGSLANHGIVQGERLAISAFYEAGAFYHGGLFAFAVSGITLDRVIVKSSPRQAFALSSCAGIQIRNCEVVPKSPESLVAANRDGIFIQNGIQDSSFPMTTVVDDCKVTRTLDDGISILGATGFVSNFTAASPLASLSTVHLGAPTADYSGFGSMIDIGRNRGIPLRVEIFEGRTAGNRLSLASRGVWELAGFARPCPGSTPTNPCGDGAGYYFNPLTDPTGNLVAALSGLFPSTTFPVPLTPPASPFAETFIYCGSQVAMGPASSVISPNDVIIYEWASHSSVSVTNNVVQDCGRGILCFASNGLIMGNDIAVTEGAGILCSPDPGGFGHSNFSRNVLIANNRIAHVASSGFLQTANETQPGAICVSVYHTENNPNPCVPGVDAGVWPVSREQRNITVQNNMVMYSGGPSVFASNSTAFTLAPGNIGTLEFNTFRQSNVDSSGGPIGCARGMIQPLHAGVHIQFSDQEAVAPTTIVESIGGAPIRDDGTVIPSPFWFRTVGFDPREGFADVSGMNLAPLSATTNLPNLLQLTASGVAYIYQPETRERISAVMSQLSLVEEVSATQLPLHKDYLSRGQAVMIAGNGQIVISGIRNAAAAFSSPALLRLAVAAAGTGDLIVEERTNGGAYTQVSSMALVTMSTLFTYFDVIRSLQPTTDEVRIRLFNPDGSVQVAVIDDILFYGTNP